MPDVQTVLGPVDAGSLGHFQPHEHLIVRQTPAAEKNPALLIDDEEKSLLEVCDYLRAGGGAVADAQPGGAGRDAAALMRLSEKSGVHIVAVTGYHRPMFYPPGHGIFSEDGALLRERFLMELTVGIGDGCDQQGAGADGERSGQDHFFPRNRVEQGFPCGAGEAVRDHTHPGNRSEAGFQYGGEASGHGRLRARAGAVKAALGPDGPAGRDGVLLRAAAGAAAMAGAPLILHTEPGTDPAAAVAFCERAGLDPSRILLCHLDRQAEDFRPHEAAARTGASLEYDTIGRFRYHDDESEIRLILHMLEKGHRDRLLLSLDTTAARLMRYGGEIGLCYLIETFLPMLAAAGVPPADIEAITRKNPARAFSLQGRG